MRFLSERLLHVFINHRRQALPSLDDRPAIVLRRVRVHQERVGLARNERGFGLVGERAHLVH